MSQITCFKQNDPKIPLEHSDDFDRIHEILIADGIRFERWRADADVAAGDPQDRVIAAFEKDINQLIQAEGYQTVDVVSIHSQHPDREAMREKFLHEHTHTEDEVRFFVDGQGLFTLHVGESVHEVLCEKGDLISIPANTRHWFDMGPNPSFVAIRLFNNPEGWVAHFTGSDIADHFSRLEN